jgi:hypothetical protein
MAIVYIEGETASYLYQAIQTSITTVAKQGLIKMKFALAALLAVASTASAHYTFPELVVGGAKTGQWSYVRKTSNYQSNGKDPSPITKFHNLLTSPRPYN